MNLFIFLGLLAGGLILFFSRKELGSAFKKPNPIIPPDSPVDPDPIIPTEPPVDLDRPKTDADFLTFDKYDRHFILGEFNWGVRRELSKAIAIVESSLNPFAVRSEPKIKDESVGLMQLLITTAKSISQFSPKDPEPSRRSLFDPQVNVHLACKLLALDLFPRFKKTRDLFPWEAVAAYNSGRPKYRQDGKLINQGYVDKVEGYFRQLRNLGG